LERGGNIKFENSDVVTSSFINALFCTALLWTHNEQYEEATTILGCATLLREKDPMRPEPQLQALIEEMMSQLRNNSGENLYLTSYKKGQSMAVEDVLDYTIECLKQK
jgi:hypothetical protein